MKKIVVLGSTNTDMVIAGKKIPVPGETISGGRFLMNPGGKGANQVAAMLTLMQNGPVDDAEIYDARAVGGAYAPFFVPETHRPRKAYRVYCAFNELRKLGTAVAPPALPDGLWACGATDGKDRAALLVANTSDTAVVLDFRTSGWRMESVRDVLSDTDAVGQLPLQIQANGVWFIRFGLPQKAISNTERNANN